ncbi:MAG: hypothetical protein NVV59_07780 [Chitinophagaceae bacterium]|nr:hypothetical protein [Chitinophagaceae bacterium]
MKNKGIAHSHEAARIYKSYYKPSLNLVRFFKSVLLVFISGASPADTQFRRRK